MSSAMSRQGMGVMGMPLGGVQNALNHKSGPLGKDSIWTQTCVGLLPIEGSENSDSQAWLYYRPRWESCQTSGPLDSAGPAATWLETHARLATCGSYQEPRLPASGSLCLLLLLKLPLSVRNLHGTLLAYWEGLP